MFRWILKCLPLNLLSFFMGRLLYVPFPHVMTQWMIRRYIRHFSVDLKDVEAPLESFPSLGAFFIRSLKPGSRPIDTDPNVIVSPVDGLVYACGRIEQGLMLQAKGRSFSVSDLLGGKWPERFESYLTLYLSPRDYHRIHAPYSGQIVFALHVPGKLFPVNHFGLSHVPNLFAVNERLITFMETDFGPLAVVKVGATNVGRIPVTYDPTLHTNRPFRTKITQRPYHPPIFIEKGAELGRFEMGSTVILLLPPNTNIISMLSPGHPIKMGQPIAESSPKNIR